MNNYISTAWANIGVSPSAEGANHVNLTDVPTIDTHTDIRVRLRMAVQSGGKLFNADKLGYKCIVLQLCQDDIERLQAGDVIVFDIKTEMDREL